MSSQPTWWVNDLNPAYSDTITVAGTPVDLSAATVTFKMRAAGSDTPKVNAAVTTKDAAGNFTYSWAIGDLDTAGQYLAWVEVTTGGKPQTLYEAIITVLEHAGDHNYIELEQLKSSGELTGTSYADQDLRLAIGAASRGIDRATGRRFWLDADANQVRYYTPQLQRILWIDDLATLTSLRVSRSTDGTFSETWTSGVEFLLEPMNAPTEIPPLPWQQITLRNYGFASGFRPWFRTDLLRSVEVTGRFGWPEVPDDIRVATSILASRLALRIRQAPLGVTALGIDGVAARVARTDPDVAPIVAAYIRKRLVF